MKLIFCPTCRDLFNLRIKQVKKCKCGKCAGKYLSDGNHAVVSKGSLIFGIDNNTFLLALEESLAHMQDFDGTGSYRFFVGWIPSKPGKVIEVDTVDQVRRHRV